MIRAHGYQVELRDQTGDTEHAPELEAWLRRALESVSETTGGANGWLRVVASEGSEHGSTYGSVIRMQLPRGHRPSRAASEWVLHHELIHASFASLEEEDLWLEEGLATYLEPLARARVGQLDASEIWREWARDLHQGAPRAGEGGLYGTHAWHRLYWQGAVFWLQAEREIDLRTGSRRSLHDALCAWARASSAPGDWSAKRAFSIMDAALGQPILYELYRQASTNGIQVDPDRLLRDLGVTGTSRGSVTFNAGAPGTALRERMTQRQARPCVRTEENAR